MVKNIYKYGNKNINNIEYNKKLPITRIYEKLLIIKKIEKKMRGIDD